MTRFHSLRVTEVRPETREALVVTFAPPDDAAGAFRYLAGQHLTLKACIDGEELRRSYSICASAQDQRLRIAIKRVDDGLFSNWAAEHLKAGSRIEVMEPQGHFHVPLEPEARRHHLAFAAGSGITPILSLIKTTLAAEPRSRFTLIYGNRASSSVIFKDELADLKDRYLARLNLVFILSREQQDVDLFNGRIDAAKCDELLRRWVNPAGIDVAYICGPQSMMEQVSDRLMAHGLHKAQIRMELFASALPKAPRAARPGRVKGAEGCQVTVIQNGLTRRYALQKNTDTLLDAALEAGIELPYSCKGGVCGTCRCKLVQGEVDMDANYSLEDYELARGFILPCQSFPVTDALLLDFDQET
ncbi:MAG: 1,2-phenylacetyl-CoA epoxidase subunit PaaE [Panacagrimonas sp.]